MENEISSRSIRLSNIGSERVCFRNLKSKELGVNLTESINNRKSTRQGMSSMNEYHKE